MSKADEHHLLVGLKKEKVVSPKKRALKKAVDEVREGGEKRESSSEFYYVFDVDYSFPSKRGHKKIMGTRVPKLGHY